MRFRSWMTLVCVCVGVVLVSAGRLHADDSWWQNLPIKAVRVVIHTEDDDKDSEESVTARVSYGPFSAEHTEAAGERWADQTDKTFDVTLATPHPPAGATFELHISKSRQGSPTGHGWRASFEMIALPESGGQMQLYINGDRSSPRSATFTMGDGEQNPNDVVVLPNAKAAALGVLVLTSRHRAVVPFNRTSGAARARLSATQTKK